MARTHRKLFPAETTTNQTQDCSGFCDPACPYNCYSYPGYYFSPPPPPPFISDADHSSQVSHISSYFIILLSLFIVIFVVVGFYVIKEKCYADWCGWRGNRTIPSQSDNSEEEFLNENQVDHPVWLITTVGLQQSIINSITVCKYRKDEGLIEGTECSVCLNEFREGETLRLLPKCNHAFHVPCIDTWLRSHTNCPLCRAGIVSSNNVTPETAMSNLASMEQENINLGRSQETQMENSQNDDGLSNNMVTTGDSENRTGTEEASEALEFTDESNSKENHGVLNDEIQAKIRLVSTDPRYAGGSCPAPCLANSCSKDPQSHDTQELLAVNLWKQEGDYLKTGKTMRRSSIEECLHISPVCMKRSFSCSGRTLSTRGYMSLNKTLPY